MHVQQQQRRFIHIHMRRCRSCIFPHSYCFGPDRQPEDGQVLSARTLVRAARRVVVGAAAGLRSAARRHRRSPGKEIFGFLPQTITHNNIRTQDILRLQVDLPPWAVYPGGEGGGCGVFIATNKDASLSSSIRSHILVHRRAVSRGRDLLCRSHQLLPCDYLYSVRTAA